MHNKQQPKRKNLQDFSQSIEAGNLVNPVAAKDLTWFQHNPECYYHLREPFPGEYGLEDMPPPHRWYVLVQLRIDQAPVLAFSNDGGKTGRTAHYIQLGHIPVSCSPVDSDFLHQTAGQQTTAKNQQILRAMWYDWLEHVKRENTTGEKHNGV
ncbi:hypothetical protein FOT80_08735 [Serratia fonticola]|nr:hypothetical protein [Serratia fonticola]